jgi:probable rRNA maturation factor
MPSIAATRRKPAGITPALHGLVALVLELEDRQGGEIGVVLADDPILREFNRRWRKIDRATDVISFAYDDDAPGRETRPVNGDIVISMDRVRAQAKRYRVTPGRELARLVIHGTLHLCGHDHVRAPERRAMREREKLSMKAAAAPIRALEKKLKSPA